MGRKAAGSRPRGSQHWIQALANERDDVFHAALARSGVLAKDQSVTWVSPISKDGYAEYSDAGFLEQLGLGAAGGSLAEFWPTGGPWWDGLGITSDKRYLLVEAKAHIGEMVSSPTGAKARRSRLLIQRSLAEAKDFLGAKPELDWSVCFFQYCNRLAHLYWMREREGIEGELVFLSVTGDREMRGPTSDLEWRGAIDLLERFLGVTRHKLRRHVHHVFIDVEEIRQSSN